MRTLTLQMRAPTELQKHELCKASNTAVNSFLPPKVD